MNNKSFKTKRGELYLGDCFDLFPKIEDKSIDCIICDLPYGKTQCSWDIILPFEKLWEEYNRVIKENGVIILFGSEPFSSLCRMSNKENYKYDWKYEKTQATGHFNSKKQPLRCVEDIMVFYNKQCKYYPQKTQGHKPVNSYTKYLSTVNKTEVYGKCSKELSGGGNTDRYPRQILTFSSDKQTNYLHPSQKPLELIKYLIRTYTDVGDTILDNTSGSSTLAIGSEILKRRWVCFEKELKYFNISVNRLKRLTNIDRYKYKGE